MFSMPNPLHAAVVHFPIVFVLIGTLAAVAALITPRWNLPVIAAILLCLGGVGGIVAVATGKNEGEMVATSGPIERVLDQHEEWADRTRAFASTAAILAIAAVLTARRRAVSRTIAAGTAVVALAATWSVVQTGHYGGQLVYRHGAGVNTVASSAAEKTSAPANALRRGHDDDD